MGRVPPDRVTRPTGRQSISSSMPPHTSPSSARLLYLVTALVAAVIVAMVEFAGAGQPEAQCKGNSPKKICPTLLPTDGATVSADRHGHRTDRGDRRVDHLRVDERPARSAGHVTAPYEASWDTTKSRMGRTSCARPRSTPSGKLSAREHEINVSNVTAPPPPPSDTHDRPPSRSQAPPRGRPSPAP